MLDIDVIKTILEEIKDKLKLPEVNQWNNSNFAEISDNIFEKTNILLSRNTIKNLVQKTINNDIDFSPQQSTRTALSQYLDYKSWNDFKQNNQKLQLLNSEKQQSSFEEFVHVKRKKHKIQIGYAFLILLVVSTIFLFPHFIKKNKELPPFMFTLSDTTGKSPHTITFTYDFSKFSGDSVFLDLDVYSAAGKYELKYLPNKKGLENFCYYNPGFYRPALYVNGKKIREYRILIVSSKWIATVYNAEDELVDKPTFLKTKKITWPRYLRFDNILNDGFAHSGIMSIPTEKISSIPRVGKNYMTEFSIFENFELDGDNFEMSTIFFNNDFGKENFCYNANFEIIGTKSNIKCVLMQPGCKVYSAYKFSEVEKSGIQYQLEGFEFDFTKSRLFKIENINKQIALSVDGNVFHKNKYQQSIGNIIGIKLTFKGSASVSYIELKNLKGKTIFRDEFNNNNP